MSSSRVVPLNTKFWVCSGLYFGKIVQFCFQKLSGVYGAQQWTTKEKKNRKGGRCIKRNFSS